MIRSNLSRVTRLRKWMFLPVTLRLVTVVQKIPCAMNIMFLFVFLKMLNKIILGEMLKKTLERSHVMASCSNLTKSMSV
jgi:hypothetical protein